MSEKSEKFMSELDKLIKLGDSLDMAMQYDCFKENFEIEIKKAFNNDDKKIEKYINNLPDFKSVYQSWYSEAQALIKQVLPDRLADFVSYYEYPKLRKEITFQNYMIRDYLQGLRITRNEYHVIADGSAAIPEFKQQLNLLKAAKDTLNSSLMDIKGILKADLYDTEIEAAAALAKSGHLRAAGIICGVVIEKHLLHVCELHNLKVKKKNPGIFDINEELKNNGIITVPQWRFIQHLADIRNNCGHARGQEPSSDEVEDLVSGTNKILKTVF